MTTGAPKIAVTELILISTGANIHRAIRSQIRQNNPPPKNEAGIIIYGLSVLKVIRIKCGTAIPTKEIGPAKAVTQADNKLEITISDICKALTETPILAA